MSWDRLRTTYDRVAGAYEDRFVDELAHKPADTALLDGFAASVSDPVLDVGCGPGQIGAYLQSRRRTVLGVDFSEQMAQRAAPRLGSCVVADMRSLPMSTSSVGGVVAFYSLIHIPRLEVGGVIKEFARVLRPQARLLVSAHEGAGVIEQHEFIGMDVPVVATLFELDELADVVRRSGLDVVRAERRRPYVTESDTTRLYVEAVCPESTL